MSVGTAGIRNNGNLKIGDIYISKKIYFYDRRFNTPNYQRYGVGGYLSMDTSMLLKKFNIHNEIVCSSDSFEEDETDREMMKKLDCNVVDMEAAGVAWVSMLTHTPMFAMKGITSK